MPTLYEPFPRMDFNSPPYVTNLHVLNLYQIIQDLVEKIDVLTTKLNADGGVTDTDYATDFESTLGASAGEVKTRSSTEGKGVLL